MIKFNGGQGALICDNCRVIIHEPYDMTRTQPEKVLCEQCQKDETSKNIKQVIVVRKDLKMRKGKMVSQGAHAAMKVFFDRMERQWVTHPQDSQDECLEWVVNFTEEMVKWKEGTFTKICVGVDSEQELLDVYKKAKEMDIPCSLIEDRGFTEFKGERTLTCCAIGPDLNEKIDTITGKLQLL